MRQQRQGLLMPSGRLGYFDVPKCASTSLKMALHDAEFRLPFESRLCSIDRGGQQDIHNFFNNRYRSDISSARHRIIVIRDPVDRFLSAYANRVMDHNALSEAKLIVTGVGTDFIFNPGLGQFLEHLDTYLQVDTVEWHLRPLSAQLPGGLDSFTRVYCMNRIQELESDLSKIFKQAISLPRRQSAGQSVSIKQLSSGQLEQIIEFCREDYELLGSWFKLDEVWSRWKSAQLPDKHHCAARKFESTVTMSRTPPKMLITGLSRKRILFVDAKPRHPEPRFRSLLEEALSKEGVSVLSATATEEPPGDSKEGKVNKRSVMRAEQMHSLPWWRQVAYLRQVFVRDKPDLLHCRGLRTAAISLLALIGLRSNAALSIELLPRPMSDSKIRRSIVERARLTCVRQMNRIRPVGLLYWLATELQLQVFYKQRDGSRWTALHGPILNEDLVHLKTINQDSHGVVLFNAASLRLKEALDASALFIGLVQGLKDSKSFRRMILLMPSDPDVQSAFLKTEAAHALRSEKIEVIHECIDPHLLAIASQVVVMPSLFSTAARFFAVGAMHAGRPLVVPDDDCGRYLVQQGISGYLFAGNDIDEGVLGVERLITTSGLPEKMGFKGRLTTEMGFTHAAAIEATAAHFSALLSRDRLE